MKWRTTAQNMQKTTNDTHDNLERTKNRRKRKMESSANRGKGKLGKELQEKYTTTWTHPGGNVRRQIDYIMINAKHRNMARKAKSNI